MTKPTKTSRQTKTPQQRAEEALGVAQRAVKRLEEQDAKLRKALEALKPELGAARKRRDYLASNPDLPQQPTGGADQ